MSDDDCRNEQLPVAAKKGFFAEIKFGDLFVQLSPCVDAPDSVASVSQFQLPTFSSVANRP